MRGPNLETLKGGLFIGNFLADKARLIGALGSMAFLLMAMPGQARADGGYPDAKKPCVAMGDPDYGLSNGTGYWCDGYQWGDSPSQQTSSRGYDYRNCTDWVAYRLPGAINMSVPRGWGNAANWDDAARAAGKIVDSMPEPGDIAQWNNNLGHVAVVENVNADGTVNVSEYNFNRDGNFGSRNNLRADNYIDLNGTGKGLYGQLVGGPPSTVKPNHRGVMTVGLYYPNRAVFDLRNTNTPGAADISVQYGNVGQGAMPLVGDWNGDGKDTIGLYYPRRAVFDLRNSNTPGGADISVQYGNIGDLPLVGDWNGDGIDTIGVYKTNRAVFDLRNTNTPGSADISVQYGNLGAVPVTGDWNNDGFDTIGLYYPNRAVFDLRNSNTPGAADTTFQYGNLGAKPLTGDWDGNGYDSGGLYYPNRAVFDLRNMNSAGAADVSVQYGNLGAVPIVGDWDSK